MGELLPIIFQRGVNQGVDPRVAPAEIHSVVENVRWRKDGRPAKRYGSQVVDVSAFQAVYRSQPVNAITSWNRVPVLGIGSSLRSQSPALGFAATRSTELPKWGPGKRDPIHRDERTTIGAPTSGFAKGVVLHAWVVGASGIQYAVKSNTGAVIVPPGPYQGSLALGEPRCISTPNFIYLICKQGTSVLLDVFNPVTCTFSGAVVIGALDAAGSHFDGQGRTADFLVSYQSAAGVVTTKLFSAIAVPVQTAINTTAVGVTLNKIGVMGDATSNVFVATQDPSIGQLKVQVFSNNLAASLGVVIVEVDINNADTQPGLVLKSTTVAEVVWGGFVAATETSYVRVAQLNAAGLIGTARTFFGVGLVSKPFTGPAYATVSDVDATYVWVETSNNSTKWDTQRAYLLVQFAVAGTTPLRMQMNLPGVPPDPNARFHLNDVLNLGTGFGYLLPVLNATRYGNTFGASFGFDVVTFRSIFESLRTAARDNAMAGRALQFAGGQLYEFIGMPSETGFANTPVVQSITGGGGGSLAGSYLYRVVYEYIDDQGRRHRSAPSDPIAFVSGANTSATLVLKPLVADGHFPHNAGGPDISGVVFHVYRTLAGQGTYHRVTPNAGAPVASVPGVATVSYLDTIGDTTAAIQELLYTDGGVLANTLPPPSEFLTVCAGRVWLAGQLDRTVVTASKLLVDGEPTQFTDSPEFSVFLPEECTAIASIDGTVIAFGRNKIYLIGGDGPNDQGIGAFSNPTELPTDLGCNEWRSVAETSIGVFFQNQRGIYLLPRGFGAPVFVGAEVEGETAILPVVHSATVVALDPFGQGIGPGNEPVLGEVVVHFVIGTETEGDETLVYDLKTGGWSVDRRDSNAAGFEAMGGTWSDRFVSSYTDGAGAFLALRIESPNSYQDSPDNTFALPTFISSKLGTGDIRPFGVAGYGGFDRVVVLGEFRDGSIVNVLVSVDGKTPDQFTFPVGSADGDDRSVYLDVTPRIRIGSSIRVTVYDSVLTPLTPVPTEGFLTQALFIEYDTIGKTKRLAQARKA